MSCCVAAVLLLSRQVPFSQCQNQCIESKSCRYIGYNITTNTCYSCSSIDNTVTNSSFLCETTQITTPTCSSNRDFCVICPSSHSPGSTITIPQHVTSVDISGSCTQPGQTGNFKHAYNLKFAKSSTGLTIDGAHSSFRQLNISIKRSNLIIKNINIGSGIIDIQGKVSTLLLQNIYSNTEPLFRITNERPYTFTEIKNTIFSNVTSPNTTGVIVKTSGEMSINCLKRTRVDIIPQDGSVLKLSAPPPCDIKNTAHDLGFFSIATFTREFNRGLLFKTNTDSMLPMYSLYLFIAFVFGVVVIYYTNEFIISHTWSASKVNVINSIHPKSKIE